ncbi:hypothetical protein P8452_63101 [Trifolium repens]|nr:hypothetical protein P8452_63101 [Trifolium repens]
MESESREKTAVRVDVCCEYSLDFITSFESSFCTNNSLRFSSFRLYLRISHDFLEQRIGVSDTPISGGGEVQRVGAQA